MAIHRPVRVSHGSCVDESCHTYECSWVSHVLGHESLETILRVGHGSCVNVSWHTCERLMNLTCAGP